jgi:hypothetical protein
LGRRCRFLGLLHHGAAVLHCLVGRLAEVEADDADPGLNPTLAEPDPILVESDPDSVQKAQKTSRKP